MRNATTLKQHLYEQCLLLPHNAIKIPQEILHPLCRNPYIRLGETT